MSSTLGKSEYFKKLSVLKTKIDNNKSDNNNNNNNNLDIVDIPEYGKICGYLDTSFSGTNNVIPFSKNW